MHASSFSYSINAYYSESPVFQSLIISQVFIAPKRENINSRSCSWVTGLSLHTKSTFLGGSISWSGKSSRISNTAALVLVWCSFISSWISYSVLFFPIASISISSSILSSSPRTTIGLGDLDGSFNPLGSLNGSSIIKVCLILMF